MIGTVMFSRTLLAALIFSAHFAFAAEPDFAVRPWNRDVIYFALLDRFFDGDPANNVPPGSDPKDFFELLQIIDKLMVGLIAFEQNRHPRGVGRTAQFNLVRIKDCRLRHA